MVNLHTKATVDAMQNPTLAEAMREGFTITDENFKSISFDADQIAQNQQDITQMKPVVSANSKELTEQRVKIINLENADVGHDLSISDLNRGAKLTDEHLSNIDLEIEALSNETLDNLIFHFNRGNLNGELVRGGGESQGTNIVEIPIIENVILVPSTTARAFKLHITFTDGSVYDSNEFVIPAGGGTEVTVVGVAVEKGSMDNTFKVSIKLSDTSTIDSNDFAFPTTDTYTKEHIDSNFVNTHGTQTINGAKNFLVGPTVPDVPAEELTGNKVAPVKQIHEAFINVDNKINGVQTAINGVNTKVDDIGITASVSGQTLSLEVNGKSTSAEIPSGGKLKYTKITNSTEFWKAIYEAKQGDKLQIGEIASNKVTIIGGSFEFGRKEDRYGVFYGSGYVSFSDLPIDSGLGYIYQIKASPSDDLIISYVYYDKSINGLNNNGKTIYENDIWQSFVATEVYKITSE